MNNNWFDVSKSGLRKLVDVRRILFELLANALDADSTIVEATLESAPELGRGLARVRVTDDDPRGFADLTHAFTLFSDSRRANDATKRGRFNFGEKIVLAPCREATITTTTGSVRFNADGTRRASKERRTKGSMFNAVVHMTKAEVDEASTMVLQILPPAGVRVLFNGRQIPYRKPLRTFETTLPTVIADAEDGSLRPTVRRTTTEIHEPLPGEEASIYELGFPVVVTGDRYHVNVLQKVPLNLQRDNVTPAYLQAVRTHVLNHMAAELAPEETAAPWVSHALGDKRAKPDAVVAVIKGRFGDKVVTFDPSDQEANHRAAAAGFTVVAGRTLDAEAWANVRAAGAAKPAGKVFPTPKPYSKDGDLVKLLAEVDWTPEIRRVVAVAERLAQELLGKTITVRIVNDGHANFSACYGKGSSLDLNLWELGADFFDSYQHNPKPVINLILHEFGHHFAKSHLSDEYHKALTDLGAGLAVLIWRDPSVLDLGPTQR